MPQTLAIPQGAEVESPVAIPAGADIESPPSPSAITNGRVLDSYGSATLQGIDNVVDAGKGFVKGTLDAFSPKIQPGENALTANAAARIVKGVGSALADAPAAVRGVMEAPDKLGFLAQPASQTAAGLGVQALGAAAGEGVSKAANAIADVEPSAVYKAAKQTAKETVKAVAPQSVKEALKFNQRYQAAKGAPEVLTKPQDIAPKVQEILKPKAAEAPQSQATEPPQDAVQAPKGESSYVHQAVKEAGPEASVEDVTKRAKELRTQGDQFEKVFNQPLENFRGSDGSFNMKDFLDEVVKPGTEPPAHVISRVFGSDGVKLVQDVSGKPIEKWAQASSPESKAAQATAQKAQAARVNPPADTSAPAGRTNGEQPSSIVDASKGDKLAKGSADKYLKMTGSDAGSILKTQQDIDTVNHFRQQLKEGKQLPPSEIRVDADGNVIEADGRHRALAAQLERKPLKVIVRSRPLSGVKGSAGGPI